MILSEGSPQEEKIKDKGKNLHYLKQIDQK
jgi:hypothetical protein